jgi:ornithine carbamoyltransferase
MRNLISLTDVAPTALAGLVARALEMATDIDTGNRSKPLHTLSGRRIGLYFRKSSTRTRTSFWAAATRLGADVISYGPDDLQLITGESLPDTARVLSGYLDALVVRTNDDVAEIRELASTGGLPVVNALSADEHPTQAIADLTTLCEAFDELPGRHVLYVGEGNSTAWALALATALTPGLRLTLLCPVGYGLSDEQLKLLAEVGDNRRIAQVHDRVEVSGTVDAVYTSRWQTMGVPKQDPDWLNAFAGFQIDEEFLCRVGGPQTVFLHDLPAARGQEVTDEVLDGDRSLAWRQAFHKMTAAMAVLDWCLPDESVRHR